MHVLAAAIVAAAAAVRWVCRKKKKRDHNKKKRDLRNGDWLPGHHHSAAADGTMSFSLAEIMAATRNFRETRVIGFGRQGKVFRGVIAVEVDGSNSTEVAIKRWATSSSPGQSACKLRIEALCKLRHRHLVPLVGSCSCSKDGETILVVYQYMPRGTLREHLMSSVVVMPWWRRLDACTGAARGLHCLHAGGVVHGAVKASNVLFDESWVAKLSDYGLSKGATMDSDIQSFGVVLFEVIMPRPGDDMVGGIVDYALACHRNGTLQDAIDPEIKDQVAPECLEKLAETAVECLAGNGIERPAMGDVLWNLEVAVQLQLLNSKRT